MDLLVQQGVVDALLGEEKMSNTFSNDKKKDILAKAHSLIILSLGDKVLREVSKEVTSASLWIKLESIYMTKSLVKRLFLKQKLFGYKMTAGKTMEENLDDFLKIILDLENIEVKVEDEDQALLLLQSLPESYSNLKDTMLYGRESITLEEVHNALLSKEMSKIADGVKNHGDAFVCSRETTKEGHMEEEE